MGIFGIGILKQFGATCRVPFFLQKSLHPTVYCTLYNVQSNVQYSILCEVNMCQRNNFYIVIDSLSQFFVKDNRRKANIYVVIVIVIVIFM